MQDSDSEECVVSELVDDDKVTYDGIEEHISLDEWGVNVEIVKIRATFKQKSQTSPTIFPEKDSSYDESVEGAISDDIPLKKFRILNLEELYKNQSLNISDPVVARLASWCAIEALSPQMYRHPSDLNNQDKKSVARFSEGLPWERNEIPKKNHKTFYEIILGSIDMNIADQRLKAEFGNDEEKQRPNNSKAVIASLIVDSNGFPVPNACAISSFAWALPLALLKKLNGLSNWPFIEDALKTHLSQCCSRQDKNGKDLPLTLGIILQAYYWLLEQFNVSPEMSIPPEFAIRKYQHIKAKETISCSLFNSFFIKDLSLAIQNYEKGILGDGLKKYLGLLQPQKTEDVLNNEIALEQALQPLKMPTGRWPMGSHALTLLQQAAVNLITHQHQPIMSVNGPPGTGKTTLLKDIIAQINVDRATALCDFLNPLDAFTETKIKVPTEGDGAWCFYALNPIIRGYEILVASSNNAAVENISHELPDISAIAQKDAMYFRSISKAVALEHHKENKSKSEPPQTWGLIAAALGNRKNRARFSSAFWRNNDFSMRCYLKAAKGDYRKNSFQEDKPLPEVAIQEIAPASRELAQQQWKKVRQTFLSLKQEIENDLQKIEEVRNLLQQFNNEKYVLKNTAQSVIEAGNLFAIHMLPEHSFNFIWPEVKADFDQHIDSFMQNKKIYPAWFHQKFPLFNKGKLWQSLREVYRSYCQQRIKVKEFTASLNDKIAHCDGLKNVINDDFFERSHKDKQTTVPWLSERIHQKRESLFISALAVHKAFIDVSAQPILHNLSIFHSPSNLTENDKKIIIGDLWASLFLIVPVISTTFASVNNMLGDVPPENIGWLLIDEAGQANPQHAVGAMMRASKIVVVGDPLQISPVESLPSQLIKQVFDHFQADAENWAGPIASVQTLADRASPYQSFFEQDIGKRKTGIPLLVHRRCENPMFCISNEIAYNDLMVSQVSHSDGGDIRKILGPSQWFSINGSADTKWCAEEGEFVIQLFNKLYFANITNPNIFIITPFRIVAQEMKNRLKKEKKLFDALGIDQDQFLEKSIGTVHTVQGREADTVILLLGAPNPAQVGARHWASSTPNILNVAVSRAKRNFYVVGSRDNWAGAGYFSTLARYLN